MPREALVTSFSLDPSDDNKKCLQELKILGIKDGDNFSQMVMRAIREYVQRHSPGNSQLVMGHWTENLALPRTLQERCEHEFGLAAIPNVRGAKWTRCLKCGAHP